MLRSYLLLFLMTVFAAGQTPSESVARNFEVQKLAEGVYAVIRKDLPGLMVDANSVFIINENDVVVVDTSGAPSTTKEVIAALRRLTNKPVKYVINTHWHDDHIIGDTVYGDAFPGVEFIGHSRMREYLPGQGARNRKSFVEGARGALSEMKEALGKNKSLAGSDITDDERASYESDIRLVELALAEAPETRLTLPTITVEDRLTLHRGDRLIEIRHIGSGHTSGDLVVHLPREGIAITGDLVVWPVPLVGSDQSRIGEWSATLEKLRELRPAIIVPGHGPVLRDDTYVRLLARLFASIKQQTEASAARGETLEQARRSVKLEEFKKEFAGDSAVRKFLFDVYVAAPAIEAAYREAKSAR